MFVAKSWAAAFINSFEKEGVEFEDGLTTLMALSHGVSMGGAFSGRAAAEELEPLIRSAITKTGTISSAEEIAVRFFLLMVKKNKVRYKDSVIREINNILDKKRGVVAASVEYAFTPKEEFESCIKEAIRKRTGAAKVNLTGKVSPELIGGYRLRIGDEVIDASILYQLHRMKDSLTAGNGGDQW